MLLMFDLYFIRRIGWSVYFVVYATYTDTRLGQRCRFIRMIMILPQIPSRKPKRHTSLILTLLGASSIHSSDATNRHVTTTIAFTHVHHSLSTEVPLKRSPFKRRSSRTISQGLYIRPYQQRFSNEDADNQREYEFIPILEQRRETERPTQTSAELVRPPTLPAKPKIVVFGASGLLGRRVVRQLLEHPQLHDATVVAFVRDYDKACRVLYDDMIVTSSRRQKGAKLVIVQGDLVPPEELPSHNTLTDGSVDTRDEDDDVENVNERSVTNTSPEKLTAFVDDEILREVIRDCTTIISCIGTVRITNLWTDFIARPLYRILRPNVSDWCLDRHHPYYVHYRTMQKIVYFAEQEQLRRQAAVVEDFDPSNTIGEHPKQSEHLPTASKTTSIPRIRLVRISDLCVAQPPWYLIPILINIFHSMIFRYHFMADQLLERCSHLDTIAIRPGDIVDDERDAATTSIQVNPSGSVPYPARISRDDTAEVVVAAALWNNRNHLGRNDKSKLTLLNSVNANDDSIDDKSFHYTLACRWVGNEMDPYPAQGHISEGHPTAYQCLQSTLGRTNDETIIRPKGIQPKLKPYGIFAAVPVYVFISLLMSSIFYNCIGAGQNNLGKLPGFMKPILTPLKHVLTTAFTFAAGSLHYIQWIVNLRSYKNVKYISF